MRPFRHDIGPEKDLTGNANYPDNPSGSARLQVSPLAPNNVIGFEMQINDNDGGGGRETLMRWYSDDNNSWQDPGLFGVARLVSRVVGP